MRLIHYLYFSDNEYDARRCESCHDRDPWLFNIVALNFTNCTSAVGVSNLNNSPLLPSFIVEVRATQTDRYVTHCIY